jgi:hypothetical protein
MPDPKLVFEMKLPAAPAEKIVRGRVTALEGDEIVLRLSATSGCAGHQCYLPNGTPNVWEVGKGPIPDRSDYKVDTARLIATEAKKPPLGTFYFHILPDPIQQVGGLGKRTEICLHLDGPYDPYAEDKSKGLGTAGCIGVRGFDDIYEWVLKQRALGHGTIPLEVHYAPAG